MQVTEDLFGSAPAPLKKSDGYFMMPGTGPANETCRTCKHYTLVSGHSKEYRKCGRMERRWTHGPGTDILARAPACSGWESPSTSSEQQSK